MHRHPDCRYTGLAREYSLEDLAAFHGHLGPYIVLGYRIGTYIRDQINDDPFKLYAKVYCSGEPPQSCLADGVQLGSGCTLGKCNIEVVVSDELKCEFVTEGKTVTVMPQPWVPPERDENYVQNLEELAERLYHCDDAELFDVRVA